MRYLFAVIADQTVEILASPDEAREIDAFNDRLESSGNRIMAVGVAAPTYSKLFDNRNGKHHVSDGPAVESDLFMAGFWVIDAENDLKAYSLAAEASKACNRVIELRPLL